MTGNVIRQDVVQISFDIEDSPLQKISEEVQKFQSTAAKAVGTSESKFDELTKSVKETQEQLENVTSSSTETQKQLAKMTLSDRLKSDIDLANQSLNKIKNIAKAGADKLVELKTKASQAAVSIQGMAKQKLTSLTNGIKSTATAIKNIGPKTKAFAISLKNVASQKLTGTVNELKRVKTVLTGGQTGAKGFVTALKNVGKISLANVTKGIKTIKKGFSTGTSAAKKLGSSLKTNIVNGFTKAIASGKQFLGLVKKLAKEKFDKLLNGVNNLAKKLGTGLVTAAKKAATAIAAIGVGAAAGIFKLTDMASDLSETTNKVDVSFGDSAGAVKEWSKNSIKDMGMAQQTALDMAALFGDMGTGMGISQKEAANMSMELTQLGADLASFKNLGIDEVTTALNGVFTGETESLKRLGIVMTQTNLEAFALSQGLTKPIDEMSESEKVMLRYNYVLSKTKNAQGDFARTGGGFANQLRMAKEQLKQIGTTVGGVFIGGFEKALKKINDFATGLNEKLSSVLEDGFQFDDIAKIAPMLGPVGTAIQKVANKIKSITSNEEKMAKIKAVFEALKTAVSNVATFVGKLAGKVTDFVTSSGFLDGVKTVVDKIGDAFKFLSDHIDGVMNVVTFCATAFGGLFIALNLVKAGMDAYTLVSNAMKAAEAVKAGATWASAAAQWGLNSALLACPITWIVVAIIALIAIIVVLVKNWDKVKAAAVKCWEWIKNIWGKVSEWFNTNVIQPVVNFFKGLWDNIKNAAISAWESISSFFSTIAQWVWTNVLQPVINFFKNAFYFIVGIAAYVWEGICIAWGAISGWVNTNVIQPVVNFFVGLWNRICAIASAVWTWICTVWGQISGWVYNNLIMPVVNFFVNLWNKITSIVQSVWNTICSIWGLISSWVSTNIITPIVTFFTNLWNRIKEIVSNVWNSICEIWGQISGWVSSNIIQPVIEFFGNLWGNITDKVSEVKEAITGAFQSAWDTVTGIWEGITDFFSKLWDGVKDIVGKIIGKGKEATGAANDAKGGGGRQMANGGFSHGAERILWGEAGPEVIIPLSANKRNRGLSLWQQAGRMMGVAPNVTAQVSLPRYTPGSSVSSSSVSSTENNSYSPSFTLNLSGTVDRTTERTVKNWIREALQDTFDSMGRTSPRVTEV